MDKKVQKRPLNKVEKFLADNRNIILKAKRDQKIIGFHVTEDLADRQLFVDAAVRYNIELIYFYKVENKPHTWFVGYI